jgi:hypothetical protein
MLMGSKSQGEPIQNPTERPQAREPEDNRERHTDPAVSTAQPVGPEQRDGANCHKCCNRNCSAPPNRRRFWQNFEFWLAAGTWVLAIVGICAIRTASQDALKQYESFAADRAYMRGGFTGYSGRPVVPGIEAGFSYTNYGRTFAEMRMNSGDCSYSMIGPPTVPLTAMMPGFTDSDGMLPPGIVIESNSRTPVFQYSLKASQEQISQAKIGNGKIYCQGGIAYDDARDNPHETRICFVFNFGINHFTMCPEKGTNRHT